MELDFCYLFLCITFITVACSCIVINFKILNYVNTYIVVYDCSKKNERVVSHTFNVWLASLSRTSPPFTKASVMISKNVQEKEN